jgi:chromosome segregation ATPase
VISQIRVGVSPVESAESFKQRMLSERTKKRSDARRGKLASLKEKTAQLTTKQKEFADAIESMQVKIDEHQRILAESHGIKENFVVQIEILTGNIQSLTESRVELSDGITRAQAAGIETRRRIEQTYRTLSEFSQSDSKDSKELTSMKGIVGELRSQMKQNVTSIARQLAVTFPFAPRQASFNSMRVPCDAERAAPVRPGGNWIP